MGEKKTNLYSYSYMLQKSTSDFRVFGGVSVYYKVINEAIYTEGEKERER